MKRNSNLIRWIPQENLPQTLYVEGLHDDYEGLRILLKGENDKGIEKTFRVFCESYIAYRNVDESNRLKMLNQYPELCSKWTLFMTFDSDFISWIKEESNGVLGEQKLYHFVIASPNDIIELLLTEPPIFKNTASPRL